jgi:hypothetical protein
MANTLQLRQNYRSFLDSQHPHIIDLFPINPNQQLSLLQLDSDVSFGLLSENSGEEVEGAIHHIVIMLEMGLEGSVRLRLPNRRRHTFYFHQKFALG